MVDQQGLVVVVVMEVLVGVVDKEELAELDHTGDQMVDRVALEDLKVVVMLDQEVVVVEFLVGVVDQAGLAVEDLVVDHPVVDHPVVLSQCQLASLLDPSLIIYCFLIQTQSQTII